MQTSTSRIEGNFNRGWGFAAFITLLVVAAFAIAFTINRTSHRSPNDLLVPGATTGESK
jgi:hypothetical protein